MPPIRRKLRKTRPYRKRRYGMRGKWAVARAPKVHTFKECFPYPAALAVGASTVGSGKISVSLSQLVNQASFSAMFDLYRITGMKIKIVPRWNTASVLEQIGAASYATVSGALPILHIAPNRDPYTPAPTTLGDILNDDGVRTFRMDKPVSLYLKSPKPDVKTSDGTTSLPMQFGTSRKFQPWLSTGGNGQTIDQSGVQHYGYRWLIDNQSGCPLDTQVFVTLYFQCKEQD